jgi:hypothetical protein
MFGLMNVAVVAVGMMAEAVGIMFGWVDSTMHGKDHE